MAGLGSDIDSAIQCVRSWKIRRFGHCLGRVSVAVGAHSEVNSAGAPEGVAASSYRCGDRIADGFSPW
jgi:hypothetical protein